MRVRAQLSATTPRLAGLRSAGTTDGVVFGGHVGVAFLEDDEGADGKTNRSNIATDAVGANSLHQVRHRGWGAK